MSRFTDSSAKSANSTRHSPNLHPAPISTIKLHNPAEKSPFNKSQLGLFATNLLHFIILQKYFHVSDLYEKHLCNVTSAPNPQSIALPGIMMLKNELMKLTKDRCVVS